MNFKDFEQSLNLAEGIDLCHKLEQNYELKKKIF